MNKVEIIADSINQFDNRVISFVCTFPRIILAELNTHRELSRNSASSRAIPAGKMIELIEKSPFIPLKWMKTHKGMQGFEYFDDPIEIQLLVDTWLAARDKAIDYSKVLGLHAVTKQITNRILEPWLPHTAIITATEWDNYFALRAHPDTEIHFQDIAYKMLDAANKSTPKSLKPGEWHIPFGDTFDEERLKPLTLGDNGITMFLDSEKYRNTIQELKVKIATARCARVSYLNFEGKDDYEADLKLYNQLITAGHMSPFEHCAQSMSERLYYGKYGGGYCGNFKGWIQHRKMLPNERKIDTRFIKKSFVK